VNVEDKLSFRARVFTGSGPLLFASHEPDCGAAGSPADMQVLAHGFESSRRRVAALVDYLTETKSSGRGFSPAAGSQIRTARADLLDYARRLELVPVSIGTSKDVQDAGHSLFSALGAEDGEFFRQFPA